MTPAGLPLEDGAVYLDLANPERGPFRALHGQLAGSKNRYLAQADTPPERWDELVRACAARRGDSLEAMTLPSLDAG